MATGTLLPSAYQTILDSNGDPVSGGLVYTYLAGTTTLTPTYSDVSLTTANSNPIVADSAGRWYAYGSPGSSYKLVFQYPSGTAIRTRDNVAAVPTSTLNIDIDGVAGEALTAGEGVYLSDGSGSKTAGSWYGWDPANTYSSTLPQIGFALANTASGSAVSIRREGVMTGLSSLTVGSTYYVDTAGALTSTPPTNARIVGSADTTSTLVMGPSIPAPALPRCRLYLNGTQVVADSTVTALNWDSETYDIGTLHSTTLNTSHITVPTSQDGTYRFDACIAFQSNATGYRGVYLRKNGTTSISATFLPSVTGTATIIPVSAQVVLAATDYIEVLAFHTAGGPLSIGSGADDVHWFGTLRVA